MKFLVEDGDHVSAGDAFAEIEVMKMVMSLTVEHNGCVHYVKRPGAVLNPGTLMAKLQIDDPSQKKQAVPFTGRFPLNSDSHSHHADKLPQTFKQILTKMKNILLGFTLPRTYFYKDLEETVGNLFMVLKNAKLPSQELEV